MRRSKHESSSASQRALDLSWRFRTANDEVIAFVQTMSDQEWQSPCEREGRTVGQVVEHIAAGHLVIGGIIEAMARGFRLPGSRACEMSRRQRGPWTWAAAVIRAIHDRHVRAVRSY